MNKIFDMDNEVRSDTRNPVDNSRNPDCNDDFENGIGIDLNSEIRHDVDNDTTVANDNSVGEDLNNGDINRLDSALNNFQDDKWGDLPLEGQKQSMMNLADCVADMTGNKNPPEIVFRGDMDAGEYGGYNPSSNTLEINENMLDNSSEAADTVAHEMWHAYQQQCALDPTNEHCYEYRNGFENYISPEYDYEGYRNQLIEVEARTFAQNFKDRLAGIKGAV